MGYPAKPGSSGSATTISQVTGLQTALGAKVDTSDKGAANGIATLDANKQIPVAQLPSGVVTSVNTKTGAVSLTASDVYAIPAADKGVVNGVASLDATGALTAAQIPASLLAGLKWKGVWNATTNTPTLSATPSANGEFYRVSVAGTSSAPTGSSVTYSVGDWLISNGTSWQYIANTFNDATSSTKGVVQLTGDLGGGAASPTVEKIKSVTAPATGPGAARKFMMSASTTALQYDGITSADLPDATGAAKGVINLAGDFGGTAAIPLVKKVNGWTIDNDPSGVNQVLAVSDFAAKKLQYVPQSGGGGVVASYVRSVATSVQTSPVIGTVVNFPVVDAVVGADITPYTGSFLLKAGRTYKLEGNIGYAFFTTGPNSAMYQWRTGQTGGSGTLLGMPAQVDSDTATSFGGPSSSVAKAYFSPSVDTYVHMEITTGSSNISALGNGASSVFPWAEISVVSGTSAVTGQSVDYAFGQSTTNQSYVLNGTVTFSSSTGSIPFSSNTWTLQAGVTYELIASVRQLAASGYDYMWYNVTTSSYVGSTGSGSNAGTEVIAAYTFTPTVTTQVRVQFSAGSGTAGARFVSIKQLGTSSVINMIGATATTAGAAGTVPTPVSGEQRDYLRGDGTWDDMKWTSYTPTITAGTTNPTLATTNTMLARYKVIGKSLHVAFTYYAASGTGAAAGSGGYMISLPAGCTINTAVAPIVSGTPTSVGGDYCGVDASTLGHALVGPAGNSTQGVVVGTSSTTIGIYLGANTTNFDADTLWGSGFTPFTATKVKVKFTAEIPIV